MRKGVCKRLLYLPLGDSDASFTRRTTCAYDTSYTTPEHFRQDPLRKRCVTQYKLTIGNLPRGEAACGVAVLLSSAASFFVSTTEFRVAWAPVALLDAVLDPSVDLLIM